MFLWTRCARISARFSPRRAARVALRSFALGAASATIAGSCFTPARADQPSFGLESLEARIDLAPGIRAAGRDVDADLQAEAVTTARSGLSYVFDNALGPRSDIITKNLNSNAFRYSQRIGVQLPLLGSSIAQSNALEAARTTETIARIDYQNTRRQVLDKLRKAYVMYWQYDRQQAIAQSYVDRFAYDLHTARALRRSGFWTEANFLDYLDTQSRFATDAKNLRTLRREQLTRISSALGDGVRNFHPLAPTFAADCRPARRDALQSALAIDPDLARTAADTAEYTAQLSRVRGSSIAASLDAGVGTVNDIVPARFGYEITAGISVSLPTHARSEERSLRAQLLDQTDAARLRAEQRRADVSADVEAVLDELENAREDLRHAHADDASTSEALRESEIRYRTIAGLGAASFNDVEARLAERFASENATAIADAAVFLRLTDLLTISPEACS